MFNDCAAAAIDNLRISWPSRPIASFHTTDIQVLVIDCFGFVIIIPDRTIIGQSGPVERIQLYFTVLFPLFSKSALSAA
jgi:hypothetical protein